MGFDVDSACPMCSGATESTLSPGTLLLSYVSICLLYLQLLLHTSPQNTAVTCTQGPSQPQDGATFKSLLPTPFPAAPL